MKNLCKFDELLSEQLKNDYILALKKCELIRDTRSATFYFAASQIPDEGEKARILAALRKLTPAKIERIAAGYSRIYYDEEVLKGWLKSWFSKHAASMLCGVGFDRIKFDEVGQTLEIPVDDNLTEYVRDGKLAASVENALSAEYYAYFKVYFRSAEVFRPIEAEEIIAAPPSKRIIRVANRSKFLGGEVEGDAGYIADLSGQGKGVVLCGRIKYLTERKKVRENGTERIYFTFELVDFTGKVRCVYFPADSSLEKFRRLKEEDEIICSGDTDSFKGNLNYTVRSIALCELPADFVPVNPPSKPAASRYQKIFPQPYYRGSQVDLFGSVEDFVAPELRAHTYVAFDIETTGLEPDSDKIIEIGAAKVVDGKVTESFSTLINPRKVISEKITELTGIDNDMVKNAPFLEDVMPDFYKFTRDSVIVGHNVDAFDMKFLQRAAVECGYYFENETVDTLTLARQYLEGLPNYRLDSVAEFLQVELETHHRATDDAICSADIMIAIYNRNARARQAEEAAAAQAGP